MQVTVAVCHEKTIGIFTKENSEGRKKTFINRVSVKVNNSSIINQDSFANKSAGKLLEYNFRKWT